ncbi:hypothetical protein HPB52_001002 [Rhipicephalus sanguineus]|uniref:GH18 domain-containing protein n=1 Tax=Rhipicephalus sanguineus TaxID=34632 RepID=A0A9D4SM04_RHISA|nr:hypothetical protein HPB52_001002 [Rhipicephalus sanguineus]
MAVPVLYPSQKRGFEPPASPGMVKTPPTKVGESLFTATDGVRSPLLAPGHEPPQHARARSPMTSPRHMKTQPLSSMESPVEVVSPQGPRVGYSFDSDESEPNADHESRSWWQLLWALCSIFFITLIIPTVVFLMSNTRTGHAPPTFTAAPGVTTSVNATYSQLTVPQTTTDLPRVTFDYYEDFLLPPGETVQDFCNREMEPDRSPPSPPTFNTSTPTFKASRKDIQLRPVICVFDAKYWRLQDTYLPTHLPLYYCSAIVVYGYAVYAANGAIVWKYPTAVRYLHALGHMKRRGQLLHRNNNITVYFTIGGGREDSANLSFAVGNSSILYQLAHSVHNELHDHSKPWKGVNVDWNYPGDQCNRATSTSNLFLRLMGEFRSFALIIIKTHTHMAPPSLFNVVRCSGVQSVAADVFNEALTNLTNMDDQMPLGYSISVATFADERALVERMNLTYSDNMAMAPVAVYDIDLDDFTGKCGKGMSPLIRAVATGPG